MATTMYRVGLLGAFVQPLGRQGVPQLGLRRFLCPRCNAVCYICSCCDRGQIYCGNICSSEARVESLRRAGKKYRQSFVGALNNAARQAAWRARRALKVTHQAPPEPPAAAMVEAAVETANGTRAAASGIACVVCGYASPKDLVRLDFVRRRGRGGHHLPGVRGRAP